MCVVTSNTYQEKEEMALTGLRLDDRWVVMDGRAVMDGRSVGVVAGRMVMAGRM
jgi:hypothetical protein